MCFLVADYCGRSQNQDGLEVVDVADVVVLDVDGTLVDSNYQHALAWYRAFRRHGITLPLWRIHRGVGMGGDQLVGAVGGEEVERRYGEGIRAAWAEEYRPMLAEVRPLEGFQALLEAVADVGTLPLAAPAV